jgi:hypothetical protein
MLAQGTGCKLANWTTLMDRPYLQNTLTAEALARVTRWHERVKAEATADTVWAVLDGAMLGREGSAQLEACYGPPRRAFDESPLADYEELGLLLWPLSALIAKDGLETLRTTLSATPAVSFVRTAASVKVLSEHLAWMAGALTSDGMKLFLRIGDTRVLPSVLSHFRDEQSLIMEASVKEWIWPDRASALRFAKADRILTPQPLTAALELDDAQYNAILDDAAADILHVELRRELPDWRDKRTGSELHEWLQKVLERTSVLGLERLSDQVTFAALALRTAGEFETAPELGVTWLTVRGGSTGLGECIQQWGGREWDALRRFQQRNAEVGGGGRT